MVEEIRSSSLKEGLRNIGSGVTAVSGKFSEGFKEFFRRWWAGPNRVVVEMVREVGYCVGAVRRDQFRRESGVVDYFLGSLPWRQFRQLNLFMSNAMYLNIDDVSNYGKALYDRLFYDFDLKDDPELARKKALEFAQSVKVRFKADPVIVFSGIKGAHIHIPLKKPITWQVYEALWSTLIAPYSFGKIVDPQVKEASRLHRVPYTYNIKYEEDERKVYEGFSYIADLSGKRIRMEDFDWGSYEPLDPSSIELYEFSAVDLPQIKVVVASRPRVSKAVASKSKLPEDPAALDSHDAPPCIRNIIQALKTSGDPDHNQRLALVWYLRWVGYNVDVVVDLFKRFTKDFNEKVTRYQVEYAYGLRGSKARGAGYLPPSCEWMRQHGICLGCGWNRNIATYTYARADVPEDLKQMFFELVKARIASTTSTNTSNIVEESELRVPQELQAFLRESGFREFGYGDAKDWIEKRFGAIDASKWHSIERTLRQLAEKCVIGRKFFVDGSWMDYGCGKIEKPPSKDVKFYIKGF